MAVVSISGAIAGTSTLTGTFSAQLAATGDIYALATVEGSMIGPSPMQGIISSFSDVTGSFNEIVPLHGTIAATATLSASFFVTVSGTVSATSGASGTLQLAPYVRRWLVDDPLYFGSRYDLAAVQLTGVLPDQPVLINGGQTTQGGGTNLTLLYHPFTRTIDEPMGPLLYQHTNCQTALVYVPPYYQHAQGVVWAFGGHFQPQYLDVATGIWTYQGLDNRPNYTWVEQSAFLLPNGKILLVGSCERAGSCELYTPNVTTYLDNTYVTGPDLAVAVNGGAKFIQLANGNVLAVGGEVSGTPVNTAQVYDWASNTWSAVPGTMAVARSYASVALLPVSGGPLSGKVFIHGGGDSVKSAEVYDPDTNTFTGTLADSEFGRRWGVAHGLPDGTVLVAFGTSADAGGADNSELYDPVFNKWRESPMPHTPRTGRYAAVALQTGELFVAGGKTATGTFETDHCESYIPLPPIGLQGTVGASTALSATPVARWAGKGSIDTTTTLGALLSGTFVISGTIATTARLSANAVVTASNPVIVSAGLIEAVTDAIGSSDTDLGGMAMTRLTANAAQGDPTITVETTFGWPVPGKISLDGRAYDYTGATKTQFTGITHTDETGATVSGIQKAALARATVLDISRTRSAIDKMRRAMLLEYAEGEDLNVVGRNLGVLRPPALAEDDRFREIVKAIAYNPRGTIYGLELALNGIVGEGNFEIFEDLAAKRNRIYISLKGTALAANKSVGKSYLSKRYTLPMDSDTQVTLTSPAKRVRGVRWADEAGSLGFQTSLPSALTDIDYPGGPQAPRFAFVSGGSHPAESACVRTIAGDSGAAEWFSANEAYYFRQARIMRETDWEFAIMVNVPAASTVGSDPHQFFIEVSDGTFHYQAGIHSQLSPGSGAYNVTLTQPSNWNVTTVVPAVVLSKDTYHEIGLRKRGENIALLIDGCVTQQMPASNWTLGDAATIPRFMFGGTLLGTRVRGARYSARTQTDFGASRNTDGQVFDAFPTKFQTAHNIFQPSDAGKVLNITGSHAVNAQGGNNNGKWIISSVLNEREVFLKGFQRDNIRTEGTTPTRVFIGAEHPFVFPDDLGKTISLRGSTLGNDGDYTIARILDETTLDDLAAASTPIRQTSTVAEVAAASFRSDEIQTWYLSPSFTLESGLPWDLSDTAVFNVGTSVVALRQALPISGSGGYTRVVEVAATDVLSAQILDNAGVASTIVQELPDLLFQYYPFYVTDPLGIVRLFLSQLTAAGVLPDFRLV